MSGSDLFTGTLDMLVLQSLEAGPRHGYAIGKWLRDHSDGVLSVGEGALYPALHRLQTKGYLGASSGRTETGTEGQVLPPHSSGKEPPGDRSRAVAELLARGHVSHGPGRVTQGRGRSTRVKGEA